MQPKNILERWSEKYKENFEIIERGDRNILAITRNKNEGLEVKKYGKVLEEFEGEDITDDLKRYEKEKLEEDMVEEKLNKLSKSTGVFLDIEKITENKYILNMKYSEGCYPLDVLILEEYESLYKALEHFECLGDLTKNFWELKTDEDSYKKYQDAQDLFDEEFKNNEILIDDL